MQVTQEVWQQAMSNLMERRSSGTSDNSKCSNAVSDYKSHVSKVNVGKTALDVGCGSCELKDCLPDNVEYFGLDAFPVNDSIIKGSIESESMTVLQILDIDTVFAFAVLDGCRDFDAAIENMKRLAGTNVVILTGINIEVDRFHTLKLELEDFRTRFADWKETVCEEISPKVYLLEYTRP